MPNTMTLTIKCRKCKKAHDRTVQVIQPEMFSSDGSRSVMCQFWCPNCQELSALRYTFYRNKEEKLCVRIKKWLDPVGFGALQQQQAEEQEATN